MKPNPRDDRYGSTLRHAHTATMAERRISSLMQPRNQCAWAEQSIDVVNFTTELKLVRCLFTARLPSLPSFSLPRHHGCIANNVSNCAPARGVPRRVGSTLCGGSVLRKCRFERATEGACTLPRSLSLLLRGRVVGTSWMHRWLTCNRVLVPMWLYHLV